MYYSLEGTFEFNFNLIDQNRRRKLPILPKFWNLKIRNDTAVMAIPSFQPKLKLCILNENFMIILKGGNLVRAGEPKKKCSIKWGFSSKN